MDYIFSHTVPLQYEPRHAFIPGLKPSLVEKSTERRLDTIQRRVHCHGWFCGHYHIDGQQGTVSIIQNDFLELDT